MTKRKVTTKQKTAKPQAEGGSVLSDLRETFGDAVDALVAVGADGKCVESELPQAAVHGAHAAMWLMQESNVRLHEALAAARRIEREFTSNFGSLAYTMAEAWVGPIRLDIEKARLGEHEPCRPAGAARAVGARMRRETSRKGGVRSTNVFDLEMVRVGLGAGHSLQHALEVSRRSNRAVAAMARRQQLVKSEAGVS